MKIAAIIVAAGSGRRAKTQAATLPKQYVELAGQSLLQRSIDVFLRHRSIDAVLPVIAENHQSFYDAISPRVPDAMKPVYGGKDRQDSVRNGLSALKSEGFTHVLVHDAARPFVDAETISNVIDALEDTQGVLPTVPVTSTLKQSDDQHNVKKTVERAQLFAAQTPQGFHFETLMDAHDRANNLPEENFTDDCSILEYFGFNVRMVDGSPHNLKITTPEDFAFAEWLLRSDLKMETRIGSGLDVHQFVPGTGVRLGEVDIAHSHKLSGHSDADAALHVLTDALLGALAEGDIGRHFPPGEDKWKGEPSRTFLNFAAQRVYARGGRIINLDLTLMCEAPKIGPHAEQMRKNIASICNITVSRVSVKATTSERMGFVGRGEGLFAQANATIEVPEID